VTVNATLKRRTKMIITERSGGSGNDDSMFRASKRSENTAFCGSSARGACLAQAEGSSPFWEGQIGRMESFANFPQLHRRQSCLFHLSRSPKQVDSVIRKELCDRRSFKCWCRQQAFEKMLDRSWGRPDCLAPTALGRHSNRRDCQCISQCFPKH
jgi:hypothetical protein